MSREEGRLLSYYLMLATHGLLCSYKSLFCACYPSKHLDKCCDIFCNTMEMNGEQHKTISALHKTMLVLREEIELKNRIILKMRKENKSKIKRQKFNKIYSQNPFGIIKVRYKYF